MLNDNAEKQRAFFDGIAPFWRENDSLGESEIYALLALTGIEPGDEVLDVACGAGVLDGALVALGCEVDAIDVSPKMIEKAKRNPKNEGAHFLVADFYGFSPEKEYDYLLVFDAYPHFPDKRKFAEKACELLKKGGELHIFFDSGRDAINARHDGSRADVSVPLSSAEEESSAFIGAFEILDLEDGASRYRIALKKK